MQFSTLFAAAALSGLAAAVQLTNTVYNDITAGKTYSIGWSNATGPVTLTLKNGGANNLQTVSTITSGATTSPFSWEVPSSLAADTYAIEISDGSGSNYSPQFQLLGATASASASTASSTGSTTAASSSSLISTTTLIASTTGNSTASSTATGSSNSTAKTTGASSTGASKTSAAAGSSKTSSGASSSSSVPATNSATEYASPLALVFLTFAAILSLN